MKTRETNYRKLLLALPLLILPFLALGFYALDGGATPIADQESNVKQGINTSLPDAAFKKEDPINKLSLYEMVKGNESGNEDSIPSSVSGQIFSANNDLQDRNEQRINDKLNQINKEINRPVESSRPPISSYSAPNIGMSKDVERLEKLMQSMQQEKTEDPEMEQLSSMLDKILTIQNPALLEKVVSPASSVDTRFRAIPAMVVNKQKAVQGATIRLQLQDTIILHGQVIPKGHEIFGTCRITNQRLLLDIKNIRVGRSIIPVDLSVYSLDGMVGIDAPEAMLGDAAGIGADNAIRSIDLFGIDQTLATQVAGAGIDAAKGLLSKKIKRIKVKLEAGQHVLLRNNQLRNR